MVSFASCAEAYKLHPTTASILDDIRFLIVTIGSLPTESAPQEIQKLQSTAGWMHERIAALPHDSPLPQDPATMPEPPPQNSASPSSTHSATSATSSLSEHSQPSLPKNESTHASSSSMETPPDYLYQSIRLAALMYTTAIVERKPFSTVCSLHDFYQLWTTIWRVPLTVWKSMMGIFLWIEVAITPPSRDTPHGRFVKSMLTIVCLNMGVDNWDSTSSALRGAIRLQAWLNGGEGKGKGKGKRAIERKY
jgi:hypothetical protein